MNLRVVILAGIAAVLPVLAALPAQAMLQQDPGPVYSGPFAPPSHPLLLTRTLWRSLQDGQQIIVSRSYAVQILADSNGYRLEGKQLESTVEAPPRLEAIAAAERSRSDNGMFPLRLDANGHITLASGTPDQRARQQGEAALLDMLGEIAMPASNKAEATAFIRQLIATGGAAAWPRDLFHPTRRQQREEREITLPNGDEGRIIVTIQARETQPGGLPSVVERTIITALGGTTRTTREEWTLRPL